MNKTIKVSLIILCYNDPRGELNEEKYMSINHFFTDFRKPDLLSLADHLR